MELLLGMDLAQDAALNAYGHLAHEAAEQGKPYFPIRPKLHAPGF